MTKQTGLLTLISCFLIGGCATESPQKSAATLFHSDMDKSSYAQGIRYMKGLRQSDIPLNQQLFLLGMNDVLEKKPYQLTPAEMQQGQAWVLIQQDLYNENLGKANLAKGQEFLDKNKQKSDVKALPSGLQYKILTNGNNRLKPTLKDAI
jgi:FKBP-type peptidyl-prolyl cis-trans isomerase FklB